MLVNAPYMEHVGYGKYWQIHYQWAIFNSKLLANHIPFGTVSSHMAGWKFPELSGSMFLCFKKIIYQWSIFQQTMFDYRRVYLTIECIVTFCAICTYTYTT